MIQVAKRTRLSHRGVQRLVVSLAALAFIIPFMAASLNVASADSPLPDSSAITAAENSQGNGLVLGKSASETTDPVGAQVTLSQYVTGKTTAGKPVGADVVLLLDTSSSMSSSLSDINSSAQKFLGKLGDLATTDGRDIRFSVISFSNETKTLYGLTSIGSSSVVTTAQKYLADNLKVGTAAGTVSGDGMKAAYNVLNNQESSARDKVVVFFTGGVPSTDTSQQAWYTKGNCATGKTYQNAQEGTSGGSCANSTATDPVVEANRAIQYSQLIKNMGGTVYSVGYLGSDAAAVKATTSWKSQAWSATSVGVETCTGWWPFQTCKTVYTYSDGPIATRRYLEMVSSNSTFKDATINESTIDSNNWFQSAPTSWQPQAASNHQTTTDTTSGIWTAFQAVDIPNTIGDDTYGPALQAGTNSVVSDYPSTYFDVPAAADVKVYTEAATSVSVGSDGTVAGVKWSGVIEEVTQGVDVGIVPATVNKGASVQVTGWDYASSSNYVGLRTDSATTGNYGRRLIVQYVQTAKSDTPLGMSLPVSKTGDSVFSVDASSWAYSAPSITLGDPADATWIPDCSQWNDAKTLCVGKTAQSALTEGKQRAADIATSTYSTGTVKKGKLDPDTPVDIYYVLDFSTMDSLLYREAGGSDDSTTGPTGAQYTCDYNGRNCVENWKRQRDAMVQVIQKVIDGTLNARLDITVYAGSSKNLVTVNQNTELAQVKEDLNNTTCVQGKGCTGPASPTGTGAQLGDALTTVANRLTSNSVGTSTMAVVMAPPTGLGQTTWLKPQQYGDSSKDSLPQADKALVAAQKIKKHRAKVLTFAGFEGASASGGGWDSRARGDIARGIAVGSGSGYQAVVAGMQLQQLLSSNAWGYTQMGMSAGGVLKDTAEEVSALSSDSAKAYFVPSENAETPGFSEDDSGYFYPSALGDKDVQKYFINQAESLIRDGAPVERDTADITSKLVFADYASAYFEVPDDVDSVKVYEQAASIDTAGNVTFTAQPVQISGSGALAENINSAITLTKVKDTGTQTQGYTVSGWDFQKNYVGKHTTEGFYGKRLIVQFSETATDDFLGGAQVRTNETGGDHDISGIYAATSSAGASFDGTNPKGASGSDAALVKFGETNVNIALAAPKVGHLTNGKAYESGRLSLSKLTQDAEGNSLVSFADLGDGSKNDDYAGFVFGNPQYVPSENFVPTDPKTDPIAPDGESATRMGKVDRLYRIGGTVTSKTTFTLDDGTSESSLGADYGVARLFALVPQVSTTDSSIKDGEVTDPSSNITGSMWRYVNATTAATSTNDMSPSGSVLVSDKVTITAKYKFVQGIEPTPASGAATTSDYKPTVNSDFVVVVDLVNSVNQKASDVQVNAIAVPEGAPSLVATTTLSPTDSVNTGNDDSKTRDFRIWVTEPYVDPGFPSTCVMTDGVCLGKQVSTDPTDKRKVLVTLTAYVSGDANSVANTSISTNSKIADFVSPYFTTDQLAGNVKVYEQSATQLGDTVEFHSNPTKLSKESSELEADEQRMEISDQQIVYRIKSSSGFITLQVQATPSSSGMEGFNVQGWDYATNYVGTHSDSSSLGRRLVVQFEETAQDCFLGGEGVPTNEDSTPGLYNQDPTSTGGIFTGLSQAAQFSPVTADISASAACATFADGKAYYGTNLQPQKLIRNTDSSGDLSIGEIGNTGKHYNDFATVAFDFYDADYNRVGRYLIPKYNTTGVNSPYWEDSNGAQTPTPEGLIAGFGDQTYYIDEHVDGTAVISDADLQTPRVIHALAPQVSAQDQAINYGEEARLSDDIVSPSGSAYTWVWNDSGNVLQPESTLDSSVVMASDVKPVGAIAYKYVDGTNPDASSDFVGDTLSGYKPTTNSSFKVAVNFTSGSTLTKPLVLSTVDSRLVSRSNGNVVDGDKLTSIGNRDESDTSAYDFRVWVKAHMVSTLPLTGSSGTGRTFLLTSVAMALIAASAAIVLGRKSSRETDAFGI